MAKKSMNPADAHRKAQRAKEIKKNKADRKKVREVATLKKDTGGIEADIRRLQAQAKSGPLSARDRDQLEALQSELTYVQKQKAEYVEKHPEHRSIVYKREDEREKEARERDEAKGKARAAAGLYDEQGKLRHPERSIYYDPVLNPFGVPPPGMPYREKPFMPPLPTGPVPVDPYAVLEPDIASDSDEDSEEDSDDSDDSDIPLPSAPPPSRAVPATPLTGTPSESESDDDDIPLPTAPNPNPKALVQPPLPPGPPPPPPFNMGSSYPPYPPPGFNPGFPPFRPGFGPGPYPPRPAGFNNQPFFRLPQNGNPNRPPMNRPPTARQPPPMLHDPLNSNPVQSFQAHQHARKHPSLPDNPNMISVRATDDNKFDKPDGENSTPTAAASASAPSQVISAAPQLRDFRKESAAFVPLAVKRKRAAEAALASKRVNAAPSLSAPSSFSTVGNGSDIGPSLPDFSSSQDSTGDYQEKSISFDDVRSKPITERPAGPGLGSGNELLGGLLGVLGKAGFGRPGPAATAGAGSGGPAKKGDKDGYEGFLKGLGGLDG
ncbi:Uncharacterized conserved low complexity protein [Phaffia rhodozyma]|uniref:Uncharacterized conserved low complexity protein n=1 Tax=Phaffia rhodozyma TaxID=264483 RepID=A0A0F7SLN2_PHARH|nr:Uncharacterized conserved low complexity protein [Phaffia rhodozyma]